jgi:hypothetical protein
MATAMPSGLLRWCKSCNQNVSPEKKFNFLFIFLPIIGVIYIIYFFFRKAECPFCGNTNLERPHSEKSQIEVAGQTVIQSTIQRSEQKTNEQAVEYIAKQLTAGEEKDAIVREFVKQGWSVKAAWDLVTKYEQSMEQKTNEKAIEYIEKQLTVGKGKDEIVKEFVKQGWSVKSAWDFVAKAEQSIENYKKGYGTGQSKTQS